MVFSNSTTLEEALSADLTEIGRSELMELQKGTLCDIIKEICSNNSVNSVEPSSLPDLTDKQQIYEHQNLLEQIVNLQNDLKKHENSIIN